MCFPAVFMSRARVKLGMVVLTVLVVVSGLQVVVRSSGMSRGGLMMVLASGMVRLISH